MCDLHVRGVVFFWSSVQSVCDLHVRGVVFFRSWHVSQIPWLFQKIVDKRQKTKDIRQKTSERTHTYIGLVDGRMTIGCVELARHTKHITNQSIS